MLKAAAGGGGKGMRRVMPSDELAEAFRAARSEAGELRRRRGLPREVRRAPAPRRDPGARRPPRHTSSRSASASARCSAGTRRWSRRRPRRSSTPSCAAGWARRRCGGAGGRLRQRRHRRVPARRERRVLLPRDEHPAAGRAPGDRAGHRHRPGDCPARVAQGEPLGPELDEVEPRGHAIEVRLYAEDPTGASPPRRGGSEWLRWPQGPGVRNDAGVYEGSEVSIHYDPMLGKLIVWGATASRRCAASGAPRGAARRGDPHHRAAVPGAARRRGLPRGELDIDCSTASCRRRAACPRSGRGLATCRSSPRRSPTSSAPSGWRRPARCGAPRALARAARPTRCGARRGADRAGRRARRAGARRAPRRRLPGAGRRAHPTRSTRVPSAPSCAAWWSTASSHEAAVFRGRDGAWRVGWAGRLGARRGRRSAHPPRRGGARAGRPAAPRAGDRVHARAGWWRCWSSKGQEVAAGQGARGARGDEDGERDPGRAAGRVRKVFVVAGQAVEGGDPLVELE
jgi:hypothetical protein